ncbi:lipid A export permease/ATP-binding protein MsbA [Catenovulum sp. SM1970]|uniref:lipid A export permease/ATP-binding protein MsbA n=1 Tax=Marinifaba aquimaris TaxID=2741323 RepID=UPI0015747F9B|nr:lipid A export permease/ATP-binding protein MsbA [Marinifaba aquimaris]NTS77716.1 lipid A export permease/ATP-binding protein MsbA [Marinifaba aquimaris]
MSAIEPSERHQTQADGAQLQQPRHFRRLFSYVAEYKFIFFIAILGMLGYAAIDVFFLSNIEKFIDDGLTAKNSDLLFKMGLAIPAIFLVRGISNFVSTYALAWVGNQVVAKIRQQTFNHLMHLPVSFHDQHSTGELISKITYDTEQLNNTSSKALTIMIREGAFVIGLLAWVFYLSWQLSLVFLILGPVVAIIVKTVSKRFRQVSRTIQNAMGGVTSTSEQMLNSHKVVLTHAGQEIEANKFAKINNVNRQQQLKLVSTRVMSVAVIQIIASFALATVLIIASKPEFLQSLSTGTFATVLTCMMMMLRPLKQLTTVNSEFQKGLAACASVFAVLDQEAEKDQGSKELERVKGNIEIKALTFTYPNAKEPALKNVNLSIPAGHTLALVGKSGSGKSTLSNLVTRFYDIEQGQILIDGNEVKSATLASLRKQFAIVSQSVTLFNDTIANNIAYGLGDNVSSEQIIAAAQAAHVLEFTDKMPDKLDTIVGENGVMLSGGQRQRIAIARAILRDAPILILDEATSALDTESERHIQQAIDELRQNRTAIVIAHRLSTIENADTIAVVDHGQIVEKGSHQALLDKGGYYSALYQLQFGSNENN